MIKTDNGDLIYCPLKKYSVDEFLSTKNKFISKFKKKVNSYFFLSEEKFEKSVFRLFKKEFYDYIDYFLTNKNNLTKFKLVKRDYEIFLNDHKDADKKNLINKIKDDKNDLDYIDNPFKFWKDLDTRIKNLFIERFIGKFIIIQSRSKLLILW